MAHLHAAPALPGLARLSVAGCAPFPALVHEGRAQAVADWNARHGQPLRGTDSLASLLHHWSINAPVLSTAVPDPEHARELRHFRVHAPVEPSQVFCTIGNYAAQLLEALLDADTDPSPATWPSRRAAHQAAIDLRRQGEPYACLKPRSTVAGPYEPLQLQAGEHTLDWEVEIGAVMGRVADRVQPEGALACVAGFCVVNDLTLRQRVFRQEPKGMGTDFLQAKGGHGWLPVGPTLVPAARVRSPQDLQLRLTLNGEVMQEGRSCDMLFTVAQQIAYLSRHVRLQPGDLVCTGSPAGFGAHHRRFLKPGDVVEASVAGLGVQRMEVRGPLPEPGSP